MMLMGWMGLSAQGISVTSFKPLPNDLTANLAGTQVKDQNGEVAALIKVVTTQTGFTFEGGMAGIVKTKQEVGEIWVYVPHGIQKITIKHPQLGVLRDYFFPCAIDAARTYEMVLASGEVRTVVTQDAGGSFLALTVEPKNASVYINGELQQIDDNGELMVMLPYGEHQYRIEANGYMNEAGVIAVGKETVTKVIRLKSALATLKINSTTPGADIIVNNQKRGTGSWSGSLTAGMYLIECQKPGYHSYQTSITLAKQEEKALTIPALTAKYGSIVVSVKPIGAEVWMDGAKLGTSPGVFSNVLATKHTIEVKKAGYQTLRKTFELAEGEKNTIDGALEKEQAAAPAPAPSGSGSGGSSRGSGSGSSSGSSSPRSSSGSLQLFPVWGITLGNTTVSDMKRLGFTVEPQSSGANYSRVHSIQFWDHSKDGVYETIYFPVSTTAPDLWTSQGLNGSLSYNEYIRFFTSRGFTYKVTKEPQVKKWQNRNTLSANLMFYSNDGNYSFEIDFDYGNDNGEGYSVDSKNTAYSFRVKALKSVAAASGSGGGSSSPRSSSGSSGTVNVNGENLDMVYVQGGTFIMGKDGSVDDEKPEHNVTVSSYYISKYEVTQALWKAVMGGSMPSQSYAGEGDNKPVANINYAQIQEFIRRLNSITGKHFRLPTEAEWEFAARGGNQSRGYKFSGSNDASEVAWYNVGDNHSRPVGTKKPNELGIYDMSGNLEEWTADYWSKYTSSSQTNPKGGRSGKRVVRGGGYWHSLDWAQRVARRSAQEESSKIFGFRLAHDANGASFSQSSGGSSNYGGSSYSSSSSSGSLKLYPVWGVDLGKSTAKDLKAQGYKVENRSDGDKYASIRGIQCWDFSHDGRFETMYFTYYDRIPSEWESQGFNTKMSYNEYIRFFTSHGYTYTVKESPQVKKYQNRNTLSAELEFTSGDGRYVIRIDFDYGNDNGEGYTVDSKCSAYSFNIKAK